MACSRLTKFCHSGLAIATRRSWNLHVSSASKPRTIQVSGSPPEVPSGAEAAVPNQNDGVKATENLTDKAYSTAGHASQKTKDMSSKLSLSAQDMSEKAQQTVQDVWGSAKGTAYEAKDSVVGKAEEGAESIKQNAEMVKKSMNTKN